MPPTNLHFVEVNTTGRPTRARRHHAKTRTGCESCKKRRIKCDEKSPKCSACARMNLDCFRKHPTEALLCERTVTRDAQVDGQALQCQDHRRNVAPLVGPDIDLSHMLLFHHFETETRFTLVHGPVVWKQCIAMALKHKCLMHSILMIAAAHRSCATLESEALKTAEIEHLANAISGLRKILSGGLNDSNVELIFAVCNLLFTQTWASLGRETHLDGEMVSSIETDLLVYSGIAFKNLATGDISTVIALIQSSILGESVVYSPKAELQRFLRHSSLPQELDAKIRNEYLQIWPDSSEGNAARLDAYMIEGKRLTIVISALVLGQKGSDISALEATIVRYLYTWPMLILPEFVDLMRQRDPCVLLLFWHFYTTVKASAMRNYWWAQRRTKHMIDVLTCRLREHNIEPKNLLALHT